MTDLHARPLELHPELERFDRIVFVGVGARTRTYAATRGPGSPFVVRVLRTGIEPARVRQAFARGATALLGHPTPHVESIGDVSFFVAPIIVGESLSRRPAGPLPPRLATRIVIAIARALGDRVHGDLYPGHVLFTADGRANLIDPDPAALGREGYRSPERSLARPASVTAEVYSLGAIWVELLTGRLPESPRGPTAPGLPPGMPPPALRLARGLLFPEPRDRVRNVEAVRAALETLLPQLPGPDVTVRSWLGTAPWRRVTFWRETWRALTEGGGESTLVDGTLERSLVVTAAAARSPGPRPKPFTARTTEAPPEARDEATAWPEARPRSKAAKARPVVWSVGLSVLLVGGWALWAWLGP